MNDNGKEIDYKTGYGCVTIALSLIAIVCSIFAMATADVAEGYKNSDCVTITVLGTIVTLLVAWQIYSTIRSTHQIEEIEEDFKALERTIDNRVAERMNILEREASAMICVSLAKSPIHLHQFSEELNKRFGRNGVTNMLNHSLYYFAAGLDNLSSLPNSENYDDIYEGLEVTIQLIEECRNVLKLLQVGVIDAVIKGIKNDKNPHDGKNGEGVNKKRMLSRLEKIKTDVLAIKEAEEKARQSSDSKNDESSGN